MSDIDALLKLIRERHTPGTPALDQSSPTGKVCRGHGDWGYPPPWPCDLVDLADEVERLRGLIHDYVRCRSWQFSQYADNEQGQQALKASMARQSAAYDALRVEAKGRPT